MNVRELLTRWGFQVDTAKVHGFNRVLQATKNTAAIATKALAGIAGGAIAGGAGLVKITTGVAKTLDEVLKTSQKVAVSTTTLQMLKHAADLGDVSFQSLGVGIRRFADLTATAAKGGKEASAAFKALGVSLKDSNGKLRDNDDLLLESLAALADMPEGAKRTALAIDLFGRAGADLLPMLDGGSDALAKTMAEARKLGVVFKKDALEGSADFNDSITRLKAVLGGVAGTVAVQLMPLLTDVIKKVQGWAVANKDLIAVEIKRFIGEVVDWLREMVRSGPSVKSFLAGATSAVRALGAVISALVGLASGVKSAWSGIKDFFPSIWDNAKKEWTGWLKFVEDIAEKIQIIIEDLVLSVAEKWGFMIPGAKVAADMIKATRNYREKLFAEAEKTGWKRGSELIKVPGLGQMINQTTNPEFRPSGGESRDIRPGSFIPAGVPVARTAMEQALTSQTASISVTSNVTVPPGTPAQTAKAIADEANRRLETAVRNAMATLQGAK